MKRKKRTLDWTMKRTKRTLDWTQTHEKTNELSCQSKIMRDQNEATALQQNITGHPNKSAIASRNKTQTRACGDWQLGRNVDWQQTDPVDQTDDKMVLTPQPSRGATRAAEQATRATQRIMP